MAEPLKHQPFMALNASNEVRRIHPAVVKRHAPDAPLNSAQLRAMMKREPDRAHVEPTLVSSPRQPPLPGTDQAPITEAREVEAVPAKKKAKRQSKPGQLARGTKRDFVMRHPDLSAADLVKEAKKAGFTMTASHVYNIRSVSKGSGMAKKRGGKTARRVESQIAVHVRPKANASRTASELLGTAIEALEELRRRLQALAL